MGSARMVLRAPCGDPETSDLDVLLSVTAAALGHQRQQAGGHAGYLALAQQVATTTRRRQLVLWGDRRLRDFRRRPRRGRRLQYREGDGGNHHMDPGTRQ